jgi:hypothetical protein
MTIYGCGVVTPRRVAWSRSVFDALSETVVQPSSEPACLYAIVYGFTYLTSAVTARRSRHAERCWGLDRPPVWHGQSRVLGRSEYAKVMLQAGMPEGWAVDEKKLCKKCIRWEFSPRQPKL